MRATRAAAGIRYDSGLVRRGPHGAAAAAELTAGLLDSPEPPSAIFAASDTQALGVLTAARAAGALVPEQLSLIGFDDIESAALLGLSTVRQPLQHSGAEAARRLCHLLRAEPVKPLRQQLTLEVVQRSTSARYAQGNDPAAQPEPPMFDNALNEPDRLAQPPDPLRRAGAEPVLEGR